MNKMHLNRIFLLTMFASGSILVNTAIAAPAFAASSSTISGNGSSSTSSIGTTQTTTNSVVQSNNAQINNDVSSSASTGKNDANSNTGGDVTIMTGNATSKVAISNQANVNQASFPNCGCTTGNTTLQEKGNGSDSSNAINSNTTNTSSYFQNNAANVNNHINSSASTGKNDANQNTGGAQGGNVTVMTGKATSAVGIDNAVNANLLSTGNSVNGSSNQQSANSLINGNGAGSSNSIGMLINNNNTAVQGNGSWINNMVNSEAKTGKNDANQNTSDTVAIMTGDANASTWISNMANFNAISTDCGCVVDTAAKVSGNGSNSDNSINNTSVSTNSIFQGGHGAGNTAYITNKLNNDPKTGYNDGNQNTGYTNDGVGTLTGDANSQTSVNTSTNINLAGANLSALMPSNLMLDFNLAQIFGSLNW